uniref:Transposase-associated domain-containing protein n=1 Tax=Chenopodium quinoa TaxID=63459 RepID=A0A803N0V5_CHEQI
MDRKWMLARRTSDEYEQGVDEFIAFAIEHAEDPSRILCPCVNCNNMIRHNVEDVRIHLVVNGIIQQYKCWIKHGETLGDIPSYVDTEMYDEMNDDEIEDNFHLGNEHLEEMTQALEFCSQYLSKVDAIGIPKTRHTKGEDVDPYVEEHLAFLRDLNPRKSEIWIAEEHNRSFVEWFQLRIADELAKSPSHVSDRVKWLSRGPCFEVLSYSSYQINGYTFYTKDRDKETTMQNSGVSVLAQAMHISSGKDKNPIYADMTYYGIINDIWELDYRTFQVPIFSCNWVDHNNGVHFENPGFTIVDLTKVGYKEEPFIFASQAKQVFYVTDPANKRRHVVLSSNKRNVFGDQDIDDMEDPSFSLQSHSFSNNVVENEAYTRVDHGEGIWVENASNSSTKKEKRGKSINLWLLYMLMASLHINHEHGDDENNDANGHPTYKGKKDTGRGATRMASLVRARNRGVRFNVQWNADGQPIGDYSDKLMSYWGASIHKNVPIIYPHWHKVPQNLKDALFEVLEITFKVTERDKDWFLRKGGRCWSNFKSYLSRNWLFDQQGNLREKPPSKYDFIDVSHWKTFVKSRLCKKFQEKSAVNRERASKNEYPKKKGRRGCARYEQDMIKKLKNDEGKIVSCLGRGELWKLMRTNQDNIVIPSAKAKEVAARIDDLMHQSSNGEFVDHGRDDVLSRALQKKEGTGRVRAVGAGVTPKIYFGACDSKKEKITEMESRIKFLEQELQELKKSRLEEKMKHLDEEIVENYSIDEVALEHNKTIQIPEGIIACQLALSDPSYRVVATGKVHNVNNGSVVHNKSLPSGYMRVAIDYTTEEHTPLPVPLDDGEAFVLKDAINTIGHKSSSDPKAKKTKASALNTILRNDEPSHASSEYQPQKLDDSIETIPFPDTLPADLQIMHKYTLKMAQKEQIHILIDMGIPGQNNEIFIGREEIFQFLAQAKIGVCHIVIASSLPNAWFSGFIWLFMIHWVLCVIDPYNDIVYFLVPLHNENNKGTGNGIGDDLRSIVDRALFGFRSEKGLLKKIKMSTKWVQIQYFHDCNVSRYDQDQIDEIRTQWACHVLLM